MMSRGHGVIQRWLLESLPTSPQGHISVDGLANQYVHEYWLDKLGLGPCTGRGDCCETGPAAAARSIDRSVRESIRRAIKTLEREGLVETKVSNFNWEDVTPYLTAWKV